MSASDDGETWPDDPGLWTVLESTYLARKPWLTLRQDRVRLPSGATIDEYFVLEYPEWINVIAVTDDERIVLVRQYRHGLGKVHFEIPGGVRDAADPSAEVAARRELLEETGYGGGTWQHFMTVSANPSTSTNLTQTFLARGVVQLQDHAQEAGEDMRIHVLPAAEVRRLVLGGGFIQALHLAPLLKYLMLHPPAIASSA